RRSRERLPATWPSVRRRRFGACHLATPLRTGRVSRVTRRSLSAETGRSRACLVWYALNHPGGDETAVTRVGGVARFHLERDVLDPEPVVQFLPRARQQPVVGDRLGHHQVR